MQLKHFMTRDVKVVTQQTKIWEAAEMMRRLNVGSLPVCEGARVVGMVTDRDITVRATAEGSDPHFATVAQCMSDEPVCCMEDDDSAKAEVLMQQSQVRRLPVLNKDRELVGIVSLGDLATKTVETEEIERTLWKVSLPEPDRAEGATGRGWMADG
jgi:CBS domain-containing protein